MYYKLTMKDKRVVFVPAKELNERLHGKRKHYGPYIVASAKGRLRQIQVEYPDCIDWEMVEPEEVLGIPPAIPVQR